MPGHPSAITESSSTIRTLAILALTDGGCAGLSRSFESVSPQQCPTSCARPWHGCLALLESASLPDADSEALLARRGTRSSRCGELVDDVLFLSELESGREVVALGSTRALPVLEEVRDRLADSAERADVAIRVEADPSVELPVRRRMLQLVAENLAENSIRYAGAGSTLTLLGAAWRARSHRRRAWCRRRRPRAALRAFLPQRPGPRLEGHGPWSCDREARSRLGWWGSRGIGWPGAGPADHLQVPHPVAASLN